MKHQNHLYLATNAGVSTKELGEWFIGLGKTVAVATKKDKKLKILMDKYADKK